MNYIIKTILKPVLKPLRLAILNSNIIKSISKKPLILNDFSGYNQPYHPSVLYFNNKFNNYHYWMVETPYPINGKPYRDRWESPCVYWSNDGIKWETNELTNPIDDINSSEIENGDFLSDPQLVYLPDKNILECWYRITHMDNTNKDNRLKYPTLVLKKQSSDGIHWGKRQVMIDLQDTKNSLGNMVRSPSIIWSVKKKCYRMWFVDSLPFVPNRNIIYAESSDGINWFNIKKIIMDHYIDPWHIDVNYFNNRYHLINYTNNTGNKGINYYESTDGIHFNFKKELLKPTKLSINEFYSCQLYRSCILKANDDICIYFTAENETHTSIGLLKGKTIDNLNLINCN